jgi:Ion channel
MTPSAPVAVWLPLAVGGIAVAGTIFTRTLAVLTTIELVRWRRRLSSAGFWVDLSIVALAIGVALIAHLVDIGLWAVLFVLCGQFSGFGSAYYYSAADYTTLGYGDVLVTSAWRMLEPLEAANGMLMFGVSTAIVFAVIQGIVQARFTDLRVDR